MITKEVTAPAVEPLHLTEVKLYLRLATTVAGAVSYTSEDGELGGIIAAVRSIAEAETWQSLVFRTVNLYLDDWPDSDEIILPYSPLRSVVHVKYTDSDGDLNTMSTDDYEVDVDSEPGRIVLGYNKTWPDTTLGVKNPIEIQFKCGILLPFSADDSTDIITCPDHVFVAGDNVRLSVSGGSLPAGLSDYTDYYIIDVDGDDFKLSTTSGGSAVDITDTGTGHLFVGVLPANIERAMKLVLSDLYEERSDSIVGGYVKVTTLPRGASILFAMDARKSFI